MNRKIEIILAFSLVVLATMTIIKKDNTLKEKDKKLTEIENKLMNAKDELEKKNTDIVKYREKSIKYKHQLIDVKQEYDILNERLEKAVMPSRGVVRSNNVFDVTAYDLSVASCGKRVGDKGYGITRSGKSLVGETWDSARAIAVDPLVIPLGSKVEISFIDENYKIYDGVYTAIDTGGAIKGNKIDIFLGDFNSEKANPTVTKFGRTKANVKVLEGGE